MARRYGVDDWARGVAETLGKLGGGSKPSTPKRSVPKSPSLSSGGAGRAGRGRPQSVANSVRVAQRKRNQAKLRGR